MKVLITGAGGFIGHHLALFLKKQGHYVRGVDLKEPAFEASPCDEFHRLDLMDLNACLKMTEGIERVYALAADMGGMGYLASNQALMFYRNSQIDLNTLEASRINGCKRLFYSSSACIYPEFLQEQTEITGLPESLALPAAPADAYGWAKFMTERLCLVYAQDYSLETRIARFHNIYGPLGTWQGGREKAPAALCRKAAEAVMNGSKHIEIWGDGLQTRSFCYIDDCLEGIDRLMNSDYTQPLNIGQDELISINDLAGMVASIAGHPIEIRHVDGPQGVRGRNSDNTTIKQVLGWAPSISLRQGMTQTYEWIHAQVAEKLSRR